MLDIEEKLALPKIELETNKYKKHINDLIEDAEIEAEMEAEKKIRSQNSHVFSNSIFVLGLLALFYFQIYNSSPSGTISKKEGTVLLKNPTESAEEKLAKQVPVLEDESPQISFEKEETPKNLVASAKITFAKKIAPIEKPKVPSPTLNKIKNPGQNSKTTLKRKEPDPTITISRFIVQAGAFSQKKNAKVLLKKLQSKGFSPLIKILNKGNNKTYLVQLGVFPNREKAKLTQEKLARAGFAKTIIK